ncbi:unnamed protein product [Cuscuta epithymum]|uniref:DNA helicase Pif1-like 2B domain-containing protein n=1 Tax=Cuscuta epithymum TaxID=186058 RepID=A0AAV0EQ62_9ASTE|nr:unnamed protein product [Cuscuta epithymum]
MPLLEQSFLFWIECCFPVKAILAPTIDEHDKVNYYMLGLTPYMLGLTPGEIKTYLSSDSVSSSNSKNALLQGIRSLEFLNSTKCSGVPRHELKPKVGAVMLLMRNINHSSELCNDTRIIVTKFGTRILDAQMMLGTNARQKFLILNLRLTPSNLKLPFTYRVDHSF